MNQDLAETCLRYLDGDLTAEEAKAFSQLLASSPEAAELLAQLAMDEQHFRSTPAQSEDEMLPVFLQPEDPADLFTIRNQSEGSLPKQAYRHALSYVLRHTFTPRRVALLATAAAVLIGVVLTIVLVIGRDQPVQQIVEVPKPIKPAESLRTVATLTTTLDAKWSLAPGKAAPREGEGLYAGQRLTLTQGFAEFRTERGAVAIIEAPSTIELLESNSLRLHSGKLLGICEIESSKGFVVRTPHLDVNDIGTEFSVCVDEYLNQTDVSVHRGEVKVWPTVDTAADIAPRSLTTSMAVSIGSDGELRDATYVAGGLEVTRQVQRYKPVVSSGSVVFDVTTPHDFQQSKQVSDKLQVFLERSGAVLDNGVVVDMPASPDGLLYEQKMPTSVLEAGQRVDVYLLHVNKPSADIPDLLHTLDFGRPILGVICHHNRLQASDSMAHPVDMPIFSNDPDGQGELLRGIENGDTALLLPGGQAIQVQMHVLHKTDQVRILVEARSETD